MCRLSTEQAKEIEKRVVSMFKHGDRDHLECVHIVRDWLLRLKAQPNTETDTFELEAGRATACLQAIQRALHFNSSEPLLLGRLWIWPDSNTIISVTPETSSGLDVPVSSEHLNIALSTYLKRKDLQTDLIDASAINAMLYAALVDHARNMRRGLDIGATNWAYVFAGDNFIPEHTLCFLGRLIIFLSNWVLLPALTLIAFAEGLKLFAIFIFTVWTLIVVYKVFKLPRW